MGFEPTRPASPAVLKDRCIRPLCHASQVKSPPRPAPARQRQWGSGAGLIVIASVVGGHGRRGYDSSHRRISCSWPAMYLGNLRPSISYYSVYLHILEFQI